MKSVKFQGDVLNFCDFIQVYVFQTGGHSAALIENGSNIYFYLFSILNYKTEQNSKHNGQLIFSLPYY